MSTGRNKVEEWTFLPANEDNAWIYIPSFDKNFVLLDFDRRIFEPYTCDILILNLVTRTKFWMRCGAIVTKVKEKAVGRIDLENLSILIESLALKMIVEKDRIVVKYYMRFDGYILG